MEMTLEVLRDACKANGGYSQPHLNDQLFLQCKGFTAIQNLEAYTNVKVLWLEQNGIMDIEGVGHLERLVSLFLHQNTIRRISGLDGCRNLRILNLSNNFISKVENLADTVPLLETLQLSHNQIESLADCVELQRLEFLSSLDISFNKLERGADGEESNGEVLEFFKPMTALTVLYLHGNSITHGMKNYRKNMILNMPQLTYLDERPVFDEERATTEAWGKGGQKAESAAREAIRQSKVDHLNSCVEVMQKMAAEKRPLKEQREREWAEARRQQEEREKTARAKRRALVNDLENEEDDERGYVLTEEVAAWTALEMELISTYDEAMKEEQKREEQEEIKAQVDKQLRREELEIAERLKDAADEDAEVTVSPSSKSESTTNSKSAAAAPAPIVDRKKSKHEEEMAYWIKQLEQSDEEVVAQMQGDLDAFLQELQPGYLQADKACLKADPVPGKHIDPNALPGATTVAKKQSLAAPSSSEIASTTAAPAPKKKAAKKNKFEVWEKYYAFEQAASKKM